MPSGEGFEKGSLNPFIIDADPEDHVSLKPKEEIKGKDKAAKQKDEEKLAE